ncbi:unannotated protein [freshwater metagenome]|jgi:hypothetical protein|uniref:Unannotated protein n=1 Tax=freshwater metagenome TaxID=449393 RepID=A0A6J6FU72_9ZZZZ|nr:DUF6457 domain-containing protein [Actinomycetes bacterium]MSZ15440.1 molybdopterin-guanine dinucleotide biosynthesis protein [Actinomycetota bacterium]MTA19551.1 molybdopterin-guanine dinucleotide biosynthesis protein [Actinomycetota bacterium]
MDAQEWLTAFAARLGLDALPQEDIDALLDLASVAAHTSERLAAPLTCYLVGRSGISPTEAKALADEIAAG